MFELDFSLFSKKNREKRLKSNTTQKYSIIEKNVEGVCHITLEASYFIIINGIPYKFTDESYVINNKSFYSTQLIDNKLLKISTLNVTKRYNEKLYLPFAPGSICKGNIVRNNITGQTLFKFKDSYIDKNNLESIDAINFYRKHYVEIINKINGD